MWRFDLRPLSPPAADRARKKLRLFLTSFRVARIWAKGVTICSSSSLSGVKETCCLYRKDSLLWALTGGEGWPTFFSLKQIPSNTLETILNSK